MAITQAQVDLLNRYAIGAISGKVPLGTLIKEAGEVVAADIGTGAVTTAKIADLAVTTGKLDALAVTAAKLASDAVTTAKILDANVTAAKLAADSVETAKILNANVTLAKLAAGITPSHVVKFAGTFTTVGGDTAESIPVVGALGTDIVSVTVKTAGAVPVSLVAAAAGVDAIAVTTSADPSNDHVLQYVVYRAAS